MKNVLTVIGLVASTLVSAPTWAGRGQRSVGIPQHPRVISPAAQKRFVTQFLNKYEGRKLDWKQRDGKLGHFMSEAGTKRYWSVSGPSNASMIPSTNTLIAPPTPSLGSHAGTIDTKEKLPRGQGGINRVKFFPTKRIRAAEGQ